MDLFEIISKATTDATTYATPVFLLMILIESIISARHQLHLFEWKDSLASIAMGLGSIFIDIFMKTFVFFAFTFLYQFRIFDLENVWWVWILLFFAEDFTFYWHHRLSHEIRILWAAHVNHHSSQNLNFAVALRQSWAERFYKYFFWMWLPLVGFQPLMILLMMSINLVYQFFQHTQTVKKLGFLEYIFNTPSHHRVHHASNPRYLDRNHAGTLIIWDRMFGTFVEETEEDKPKFGIVQNIETYNPIKIATHEFINIWKDIKKSPDFKTKLKYIFYPPGWSHDGSKESSKQLRERFISHLRK